MTPGNHRLLTASVALFCLLVVMLAAAPAAPAKGSVAKAKARLRAVQARLSEVSVRSEIAVEKYNQATARLETVRAKIDENERLLRIARESLDLANEQLLRRAEDMYKSRDIGVMDVILQADTFDDLINQMDMMQRLGNSDVDTVRAIADYKREIRDRRIRLKADEKAAAKLVAEREQHRNELVALESDLRDLTQRIKKQIKRLRAQAKLRAQLGTHPESRSQQPRASRDHRHRQTLLRRALRVGRSQPERLRLQRPHHVLLRADRREPLPRRDHAAACEHAGGAVRPAAGRPHLLR